MVELRERAGLTLEQLQRLPVVEALEAQHLDHDPSAVARPLGEPGDTEATLRPALEDPILAPLAVEHVPRLQLVGGASHQRPVYYSLASSTSATSRTPDTSTLVAFPAT